MKSSQRAEYKPAKRVQQKLFWNLAGTILDANLSGKRPRLCSSSSAKVQSERLSLFYGWDLLAGTCWDLFLAFLFLFGVSEFRLRQIFAGRATPLGG